MVRSNLGSWFLIPAPTRSTTIFSCCSEPRPHSCLPCLGGVPTDETKCRKRGKGGAVDERVRTGRGEFNPSPPSSGVRLACAGCRIRNGKGRQGWSYPEPQLTETGTWASVALDNQDSTSLAICSARSTSCEHRKVGQTYIYWSTMQARRQGCQDPERNRNSSKVRRRSNVPKRGQATAVTTAVSMHLLEQEEEVSLKVFRVDRPRVVRDAPQNHGRPAVDVPSWRRKNEVLTRQKQQQLLIASLDPFALFADAMVRRSPAGNDKQTHSGREGQHPNGPKVTTRGDATTAFVRAQTVVSHLPSQNISACNSSCRDHRSSDRTSSTRRSCLHAAACLSCAKKKTDMR